MIKGTLSEKELERYARHVALGEIGVGGQEKLKNGSVLVIGAGGLGSPAALYLAAAGVGTIGLVDSDEVDLSNLQRQIIHSENNIGKAKVKSAKERLNTLNSDITVNTYHFFVNEENISDLILDYDFILDCTDNFASKFMINDACVKAGKSFCHAGIVGFEGQIMTYVPDKGPCYRCIFGEPPEKDFKETGVIGALPGVIGSLEAMEAIKYLTAAGELLTGTLLTYNALNTEFRKVKLPKKNKDCPICGKK